MAYVAEDQTPKVQSLKAQRAVARVVFVISIIGVFVLLILLLSNGWDKVLSGVFAAAIVVTLLSLYLDLFYYPDKLLNISNIQ